MIAGLIAGFLIGSALTAVTMWLAAGAVLRDRGQG